MTKRELEKIVREQRKEIDRLRYLYNHIEVTIDEIYPEDLNFSSFNNKRKFTHVNISTIHYEMRFKIPVKHLEIEFK